MADAPDEFPEHTADELTEQERVFALAPVVHGRSFAATWWGRAWLKALEDTALESHQLAAGRRLARSGSVGAVSVRPGRLTSVVRDKDGTGIRADVLLHRFTTDEWDRFFEVVGERAGHLAALLAHDMPHHLAEDAAAAGIELLPGIGDLEAECDCGAWDHCAHSSALCYQAARLLDEDPFVLLLLRGLGEGPLLEALEAHRARRQRTTESAESSERLVPEEGVDAYEAFAAADILPPLPTLPPLPAPAPALPSLATKPAPGPAPDTEALSFLMTATAARARALLARSAAEGHEQSLPSRELSEHDDAVRLLAVGPPEPVADRLREALALDARGADTAVRAWRTGGAPALRVLDSAWEPDGPALARALSALDTAWADEDRPGFVRKGNAWTLPGRGRQLRLGQDGRWWPYAEDAGRWVPAGAPDSDPAAALSEAVWEARDEA
ncbi:SWF or SNF family helicase [Streptomyces sp. NA04227]|uniref:SWIM zinc finger family protein n=1 Tax=Streptomyces sp. NA04227 TaxID=2742136 RepID=UPI001590925D|nr:SWF or SNF family helicase [Streptomyces sp. NA04227]QKW10480.1 SWF or SNF family helicase [Streptomyces sp. NA04227]